MHPDAALSGEKTVVEPDLGPLAWVLDELRKSLDSASKALKRFVRDAELSRGSDIAALDASQLRIARQQLHQAVGALEMVGLAVPAKMLRAMEALVQKFVQRPESCSDDAALKVELASFALTDYLEGLLKGKSLSSVALFPQYSAVLNLLGSDRVHPSDLWSHEWQWLPVPVPNSVAAISYDAAVRTRIDGYVLNVVKSAHTASALAMADICWGFAAAQSGLHARTFWALSSAYFESVALGLCVADIYTKRAASRILLQYRTLARGEPDISEGLAQDLLFFCAQAVPTAGQHAPALRAVREAYGLVNAVAADYVKPQFGRFDPALLAQARKRIAAATETWSSLSGGDVTRIKVALDQFSLVSDSIMKLHPDSLELAQALTRTIESVAKAGTAPAPSMAMEVATAVLYLEAAYDDLDPTSAQMGERSRCLAQRLDRVLAGGESEPLDNWMEELYRRVSDRQIMGSVVDELRTTLGEVEAGLDAFFRNCQDKSPLHEVPGKLAQMRGVFSVLGLDQAALATLRLRDSVAQCLVDEVDPAAVAAGAFEKLGNSLGTLGFLIDMLSYQRELAKKLFVYDENLGEFRSLMGRQKDPEPDSLPSPLPAPNADTVSDAVDAAEAKPNEMLATVVMSLPTADAAPAAVVPVAPVSQVPPPALDDDEDDAELLGIFLDEAREVVVNGLQTLAALQVNGADFDEQTALRRAFHTLKGSSRMVGLTEFGEAAWALEQVLNAWLPQQKPASPALIKLSGQAMTAFGQWVEDIAAGQADAWRAQPFRTAADSLRLENV
ncbi:Hpt domain-containing protein, partial [Rhodoferax sp.]|uniref:Hpt domain-containing protein n=1 Tax=Rhodoferax sp. TaxID=50421 RepID=UPI00260C971D